MALKVGIIGAGIAGLSSAIALQRAGHSVEVFEQSQFKSEVGAAITVTPNGALVLKEWGFDLTRLERLRLSRFVIKTIDSQISNV
jgi:salicylate hydroxylase